VTDALRNHTPKICDQQSITLPPEAGAKFSQTLLHESDEWNAVYDTLRNSVEGMNVFIKYGLERPSTTLSGAGFGAWRPEAYLWPSCCAPPT
jgi:hypothetical protein